MGRISAVLITANEYKNIGLCLESVKWVDEIVIVDSGSTDGTTDIARKYTDKIFIRVFKDFADQRNFADAQASCPWILEIDADERVTPELRMEIEHVIKQEGCDGYWIPRLDYMFGKFVKHGGWYPQYHIRLYKRGKTRWIGKVHERIILDGKCGYLKNEMLHFSHLKISDFVGKMNRYTSMEAEYLYEEGQKSSLMKILFWPFVVFIYKYFYCLGFLDGMRGVILACSLAYYHFLKYVKLWEKWYVKEVSRF